MKSFQKGLKVKITEKFSVFAISVLLTFIAAFSLMLFFALNSQMEQTLTSEANSLLRLLENRLTFLKEKTTDLSKNSFIINSLVDTEGRKLYLPQLIKDFSSTAGLISVSVVDFTGKVIQSSESNKSYKDNVQIQKALSGGQLVSWLNENTKNIVIISPIIFYETPQGAIISEFRMKDIFNHSMTENQESFYKIFNGNTLVHSYGFNENYNYTSVIAQGTDNYSLVRQLDIRLEMGKSTTVYYEPIFSSIWKLSLISFLLLSIALFFAKRFGDNLSNPILSLCEKLSSKTSLDARCSPVGTNDELELLAEKFDLQADKLIQAKLELEDRVEQRTRELSLANDNLKIEIENRKHIEEALENSKIQAENANRAKSLFLANMSHEIRTPLNAIIGYSQILLRNQSLDAKQKSALRTIDKSGSNLLELINEILDISKIEAGKMEFIQIGFDLNSLIYEIEKLFELRCHQKQLDWTVESTNEPCLLFGDENKLRAILINLIGNAIKFTESGGIKLKISKVAKDEYQFEVIDTGYGIAEEDQEMIFTPFSQQETGSKLGGTGLGLAITKKQLQIMGSEIHLDSKLGGGSRFYFTLHLPEAKTDIESICPQKGNIIGLPEDKQVKALVVDDILENREVLTTLLSDLNIETIQAENGKDCLNKIPDFSPDIIFMDMRMPVMDGEECIREIRNLYGENHFKIFILTASALDQGKSYNDNLKSDAFLTKPFSIEQIVNSIEKHLNVKFDREREVEKPNNDPKFFEFDTNWSEVSIPNEILTQIKLFAELYNITRMEEIVNSLLNTNDDRKLIGLKIQDLLKNYDISGIQAFLKELECEKT